VRVCATVHRPNSSCLAHRPEPGRRLQEPYCSVWDGVREIVCCSAAQEVSSPFREETNETWRDSETEKHAYQGVVGTGNQAEETHRTSDAEHDDMVKQVVWLLTETPPEYATGPKKALEQLQRGEGQRKYVVNAILHYWEVPYDDARWRRAAKDALDGLLEEVPRKRVWSKNSCK
jgi:hypothetical protein